MKSLLLAAALTLALGGSALAKPMAEFPAVDEDSFTEPSGDQVLALSTVVDAPAQEVWRAVSTEAGWKSFAVRIFKTTCRHSLRETSTKWSYIGS